MKKILIALFALTLLAAAGCGRANLADCVSEPMPESYGRVLELALAEWDQASAQLVNPEVTQSSTMARPDGSGQVVIQFTYTADNGAGQYGLLYQKDASGQYTLLRQGPDVDLYDLLS